VQFYAGNVVGADGTKHAGKQSEASPSFIDADCCLPTATSFVPSDAFEATGILTRLLTILSVLVGARRPDFSASVVQPVAVYVIYPARIREQQSMEVQTQGAPVTVPNICSCISSGGHVPTVLPDRLSVRFINDGKFVYTLLSAKRNKSRAVTDDNQGALLHIPNPSPVFGRVYSGVAGVAQE
jgi:hypothetical protein